MSRSFWIPVVLSASAFAVGLGAGLNKEKPAGEIALENIAKSDPRIEILARAICVARGINPDRTGPPYRGPVWELYILQARDFLAAFDAARAWEYRHPGTFFTPGQQ
jgi:hypothetical protein